MHALRQPHSLIVMYDISKSRFCAVRMQMEGGYHSCVDKDGLALPGRASTTRLWRQFATTIRSDTSATSNCISALQSRSVILGGAESIVQAFSPSSFVRHTRLQHHDHGHTDACCRRQRIIEKAQVAILPLASNPPRRVPQ